MYADGPQAAPYFSEVSNLIIPDQLIINNNVPEKISEEDWKSLRDFIRKSANRSDITGTNCAVLQKQQLAGLPPSSLKGLPARIHITASMLSLSPVLPAVKGGLIF